METMIKLEKWDGKNLEEVAVEWHLFSDGCRHINGDLDFGDSIAVITSSCTGDLESVTMAELLALKIKAKKIVCFFPYLPGARQDKAGFNVASYALIRLRTIGDVVCLDQHSYVHPGVSRNIRPVSLVPAELFDGGDITVIAPDAGAELRAAEVAAKYGATLVVASKSRDSSNNFRIGSYSCPPIRTKEAIVIDDICDGGGTFLALAESIDVPRDSLTLWTTHGIYSKGATELRKRFSKIITTDSLESSIHADKIVSCRPSLTSYLEEVYP